MDDSLIGTKRQIVWTPGTFSKFQTIADTDGWDETSPHAGEVMSTPITRSQYSSMPSGVKRSFDVIPSRPAKRYGANKKSQELIQPGVAVPLPRPIKGIGYITPGSMFDMVPRILKHEFAFDLLAPLGRRVCTCTNWRHTYANYVDTAINILSPDYVTGNRTYDSVSVDTPVRVGNNASVYSATNYPLRLYSSTNLQDLELASWNAKPLKILSDPSNAYTSTLPVTGADLQVYQDYVPDADHPLASPFPDTQTSNATARPPFLVNLGSGSVTFVAQNKLPTNCEIEFVVQQIRDVQSNNVATAFPVLAVDYSNNSCLMKDKGPRLTTEATGSGGTGYTSYDCVNDPDYKFLKSYPALMDSVSPVIERHRNKFILQGGAMKTVTFKLPPVIYDSAKNSVVSGDSFIAPQTEHSMVTSVSWMIWVALNGVVMPVFSAPNTNNTNSINAPDHTNLSVIDRQQCNASVVFTGVYTEHPMPALETRQIREYTNFPKLKDTVLLTSGFGLASGLVNTMPVSVATGNVVTFTPVGSTAIRHEDIGT